jgi:hypothetical protein
VFALRRHNEPSVRSVMVKDAPYRRGDMGGRRAGSERTAQVRELRVRAPQADLDAILTGLTLAWFVSQLPAE